MARGHRARPAARKDIALAGSNRLVVRRRSAADCVQVVTADGAAPITVEVTSRGITLKIDGPEVALHTSGALRLSARNLVLGGSETVEIACGGDLGITAVGELRSEAGRQTLRASRGSVNVKASDDVKLSGERVMVNCDETIDRYYRDAGPAQDVLTPEQPHRLFDKSG